MSKSIGTDKYISVFQSKLESMGAGKNGLSLVLVGGPSGTGKTALLENFHEAAVDLRPDMPRSLVSCELGVGDTNVGQTQPLRPFIQTMEKLLNFRSGRAKKRFAYNLGITVLTAIPLVGDVFYAAKEIGRDWEKYQKEQRDETAFSSSQIEDFYAAFVQMSKKNPLIVMIDDAHKADAQSIELLAEITAKNNKDIGEILLVIAYDSEEATSGPSPFSSWLNKMWEQSATHTIGLQPFSEKELRKWLLANLESYTPNSEFEHWLYERTGGNQSVLAEYLRYFRKNPPIDDQGQFRREFYDAFLPSNVYDAIGELASQLSTSDLDFLCTAAAEGTEFTVYMLTQLTGMDAVGIIRKLRAIENEHGIVRPLGPRSRYGEKTTVYSFSRHYYHNYFQSQLQYEELTELHSRIAETLNKKFQTARSNEEKAELIGYIAAHGQEAGDEQLTENILRESIGILGSDQAQSLAGSLGIAFEGLMAGVAGAEASTPEAAGNGSSPNSSEESIDTVPGVPVDIGLPFEILRHRITAYYNLEKYSNAYEETQKHILYGDRVYSEAEMIMLMTMQAKTLIELNELDKATSVLKKANELLGESDDPALNCLIMNTQSILLSELGQEEEAEEILREAAKLVVKLQPELKIMTLANIGRLTEGRDPELADRYYEASEAIRNELALSGLIIRN